MSQILVQQSLRPQQFQNQNEILIAQIKASEIFVLRHFNHPFSSSLTEVQRAIHLPLTPPDSIALGHPTCDDQAHIQSDPPTPHFSGPEAKEQAVVGTGEDAEPEQAENASKNDHEDSQIRDMSPSNEGESGTDRPAGNSQRQESVQTYDTSPQIPETPPEVLYDEEDEQLVTREKGLVQGCSNRHPVREETYGIQTRSKTGPKSKVTELVKTAFIVPHLDTATGGSDGNSFLTRGPDVLGSLWDKAGRAGRLEVMREVVYDMISTLRLGVMQMRRESNSKMLEDPERCSNLQTLREELETSNAGEQLYRLRRRVALVQFYDEYTSAQADPHAFLYPGQNKELSVTSFGVMRKRKRGSSSHTAKRCGSKLSTLVHNRIVDLMFPGLVLGDEDIGSEETRAKQEEKISKRKAASQKVKNWRANGKPWSALVHRFDWGILLLLPTDLLDQK